MGAVRALDHVSVFVPTADATALRLAETGATVFDHAGCLRLLLAGSGHCASGRFPATRKVTLRMNSHGSRSAYLVPSDTTWNS